MRKFPRWLLPLAAALLAGCSGGGGGTSSGGGGDATTGTFTGTFAVTLTTATNTVTDGGPITMVVTADGTVIRDPATDGSSGTLNGDTFTITDDAASFVNDPSLNCTGTIVQTGTVAPGTVSGTFSATGLVCNGVAFTLNGTFTTSFSSAATSGFAAAAQGGLRSSVSGALSRGLR
jgi:hypothetical protein